jgi:DNA polymerase
MGAESLILANDCQECPLAKGRERIVWGWGSLSSPIFFVAEAPGKMEDEHGTPFYPDARAGKELDHLFVNNLFSRENGYVTNMVKCHPPFDRDPKVVEIETCSAWLMAELACVRPRVIGTIGRVATRFFLGYVNMETHHGIPMEVDGLRFGFDWDPIVVPLYHPAAGLRDATSMLHCQSDFPIAFKVLRGEVKVSPMVDEYEGKEEYIELRREDLW